MELRDHGARRAAVAVARERGSRIAAAYPNGASGAAATTHSAQAAGPPGTAIVLPHLNANEESAALVEWLVDDGDAVSAGQPVAVVETAKASTELEAPAACRIRLLADADMDQSFGSRLAVVGDPQGTAAEPTAPAAPGASAAGPTERERQRRCAVQSAIAAYDLEPQRAWIAWRDRTLAAWRPMIP